MHDLTLRQWAQAYHAVTKPCGGVVYADHGGDLATVEQHNPVCVWTVQAIGNDWVAHQGFHHVDRIGYLLSKLPAPKTLTQVRL